MGIIPCVASDAPAELDHGGRQAYKGAMNTDTLLSRADAVFALAGMAFYVLALTWL